MQKQLNVTEEQSNESNAGKQAVDLASPGVAAAVSKRLLSDIDNYCATTYDGGPRWHLGASLIGHDCKRYLWYIFRWCLHEKHDGRQQRLFNRGHREEDRFVEWLRGIGCIVEDRDPITGEQFKISGVNGHFGGSEDGEGYLPPEYGIPERILYEFKTNGTGAGFKKLLDSGMPIAKPQHFAQTSTYGYKKGFRFVAYLNINKNDDSLHIEVVKLDHKIGAQMEIKAEQIITSPTAPPRLSDNPTYRDCGWCAMKAICHEGAPPEKNCRSCANAVPIENAQWGCTHFNQVIPREFIEQRTGCDNWVPVTEIKK